MQPLAITFIQSPLHWESPEANLGMFEELIWQIESSSDVILLPEMFTTGFSMNVQQMAEPHGSKTLKWMQQMASQSGATIIGSYMVSEGGAVYNRLYCVQPTGAFVHYDKRHLFRMGREHRYFNPGRERLVIEVNGWRICPLVCYDLRFPVWSRNVAVRETGQPDYDLLLYVANWPAARTDVWKTLLKARAIENLCYAAGLNITGVDGEGTAYCGDSLLADYKGHVRLQMGDATGISTVKIDKDALDEFRNKFPAHLDADRFHIEA